MKVYYVDRVILRTFEEDGTYTAMSILGNQIYPRCRMITPSPDQATYAHIGRHALLMCLDNQNFILGYYVDEYEDSKYKIYLEGEEMIRCGESRAFITGDNGYVGVYHIRRDSDGSISKIPLVEYSGDNELSATFTKMIQSMADGTYIHRVDKDKQGNTTFKESIKGSSRDMGSRYKRMVKLTPTGMDVKTLVDCSPGPVGTAPEPTPDAIPVRTEISHTPNAPIKISQYQGPLEVNSITTDALGNLEISCGAGAKATIKMDIAGTMTISAPAGINVVGAGQSLIDTLKDFISSQYNTHVHPTPVGPSASPAMPDVGTPIKLTTMKGGAR